MTKRLKVEEQVLKMAEGVMWKGQALTESSLNRLFSKYQKFDGGTISACRGNLTYKENEQRTKQLKADLLKLHYSVTRVSGKYIENYGDKEKEREVSEKSFIVFDHQETGKLKGDLIKLGKKYGQDSVTFSERGGDYYLIGTKADAYPGLGKEAKLGKPMFGKGGEFHSRISGRPFVFEECDQLDHRLCDFTPSTIRALMIFEDYAIE